MNSIQLQSGFATAEEVQGEFDVLSAQNAPGPAAPAAVATTAAPPVSATPADQGNQASSPNNFSSNDSSQAPAKRPYPAPAELPTQRGPKGLRFDFNDGCRLTLPESEGPWRVCLSDLDTGNILFQTELKAGRINSSKRYFIRFRLEVWQNGESLLVHDYSARDHDVLSQFPVGTLGDPLGWFPYAVKFQERHGCRLSCAMAERLIPLFKDTYPQIRFLTHEQV